MRTPFIAANWKMYKTVHEAVAFVKEFRTLVKDVHDVEIVVAPPFTALRAVVEAAHASAIGVAGQNVFWEREGAFTGEVSAPMLKEAGAEYVIIGHSERRRLFGDTDQTVNRKLLAAVASQLTAIVCIGETLEQRERNETLAVLDRQIKDGLDGLSADQIGGLVDRVRARVGYRHRPQCDAGTGGRGARAHPQPSAAVVRRERRGAVSHHLRRQRETGQHPRTVVAGGRGRRAGGRREPRRPRLLRDRHARPGRGRVAVQARGREP